MNAVLGFVYKKEAAPAVGEGQSSTKQTQRAIAEAPQWDGTMLIPEPDDRSATRPSWIGHVISHYRDAFHLSAEYQLQGTN